MVSRIASSVEPLLAGDMADEDSASPASAGTPTDENPSLAYSSKRTGGKKKVQPLGNPFMSAGLVAIVCRFLTAINVSVNEG